jgi:hypothetical protein
MNVAAVAVFAFPLAGEGFEFLERRIRLRGGARLSKKWTGV